MKSIQNETAFTVIELVVTLALLGILTTIVSINFLKYAARARQAEAKLCLSGIYAAEKTFFPEYSTYSACLAELGYIPEGNKRYYSTGFSSQAATANTCGPEGGKSCTIYNFEDDSDCIASDALPSDPVSSSDIGYAANLNMNSALLPISGSASLDSSSVSSNAFTANAYGAVSTSNIADIWTINHLKHIINTQVGY